MKRNTSRGRPSQPNRTTSSPAGRLPIQNSQFQIYNFLRVGFGNDVHRLAPGRKLILGGVHVRFERGPVGHSDGDALAHAICDALLGAAALGDIGRHFPDTSSRWHNASSLLFLRHVRQLLERSGYAIVNVDATISLQRPQLAPFMPHMQRKVAVALGIRPTQVSVKAKTGEGLDAVGRGEAVRTDAVALITRTGGPG